MNNKLMIGIIALMILSISVVSATNTNSLTVTCPSGWWLDEHNTCQQWELQDEFDTVAGWTNDNAVAINHNKHRITRVNHKVNDLNDYVDNNQASWSVDHRGTSMRSVIKYLDNTFLPSLKSLFATKDEVAVLEDRVAELEIMVEGLNGGLSNIYSLNGLYYGSAVNGSLVRVN